MELDVEVHLKLRGDLSTEFDSTIEVGYVIRRLEPLEPKKVVVDASTSRITPDGVEKWVSYILDYLPDTPIEYLPSQLAHVLKYDDSYSHKHTTFPEDGT